MSALSRSHCFPNPQNLKQLWQEVHEEEISVDLAIQACLRLLDPPYLDEWLQDPSLDDLLVDETSFSVRPDLLHRLPAIVAVAFQETLGKIAYIKEMKEDSPLSDLHLVTQPISGERVAEISAHVVAEDESAVVNTDLPLIMDPDELDSLQKLTNLWPDAAGAIEWLSREMKRKGDLPSSATLTSYFVNPTFVASIQKYNFHKSESRLYQIIRKCVLLLSGYIPPDPDAHHTLDKHKQRYYGDWGAWRLHVTGSPLAIRLHYWRLKDQFILMHVVPFDNLSIDTPPKDAFS